MWVLVYRLSVQKASGCVWGREGFEWLFPECGPGPRVLAAQCCEAVVVIGWLVQCTVGWPGAARENTQVPVLCLAGRPSARSLISPPVCFFCLITWYVTATERALAWLGAPAAASYCLGSTCQPARLAESQCSDTASQLQHWLARVMVREGPPLAGLGHPWHGTALASSCCLLASSQVEQLSFREVPALEKFFPNSVKMAREVVHESTGEVLKVGDICNGCHMCVRLLRPTARVSPAPAWQCVVQTSCA